MKHINSVTHETKAGNMTSAEYSTKEIGDLGEKVAVRYLIEQDFTILATNYWKKWGEIDIIAEKQGIVHFVEVKTVSYETVKAVEYAVSHETWRPEEQVHRRKIHQIEKALESWIVENDYQEDWFIDVIGVRIVPRETYATVNYIENITQ